MCRCAACPPRLRPVVIDGHIFFVKTPARTPVRPQNADVVERPPSPALPASALNEVTP